MYASSKPRLVLSSILLVSAAVCASDYAFLAQHTAFARYDDTDKQLMLEAAREVLEAEGPLRREWKNPETGHSGDLEALNSFESTKGRFCKRVRFRNRAGTIENRSSYPVCRGADGIWKIDSGAKPAG